MKKRSIVLTVAVSILLFGTGKIAKAGSNNVTVINRTSRDIQQLDLQALDSGVLNTWRLIKKGISKTVPVAVPGAEVVVGWSFDAAKDSEGTYRGNYFVTDNIQDTYTNEDKTYEIYDDGLYYVTKGSGSRTRRNAKLMGNTDDETYDKYMAEVYEKAATAAGK